MFELGFPVEILSTLHKVLGMISQEVYGNGTLGYTTDLQNEEYELLDGSIISFPYRIYYKDNIESYNKMDDNEKLIYDCIFTRSCDGYIREKHILSILEQDFPEWCMPYIMRLSSEYIVEIVNDIYAVMKDKDNTMFMTFCENNPYMFRYMYSRMVSYWNEFYRGECYKFHDYVGYKLYKECFGYRRYFENL